MATNPLDEIIKQIEMLTPDDQLRLIEYLAQKARDACPSPEPRRRWSEIRGIAQYSMLGEDAQGWVSRTRRESDEHREKHNR